MTLPRVGILAADLTHKHGWAHYSTSFIDALRRAGVDVKVVTPANSPHTNTLDLETLRILPNIEPLAGKLLLKLIPQVPRVGAFLRDCDVIHSLIEPYAPLGAWIAGKRPFYVTGHGSYVQTKRAYRWWSQPFYKQAFRRSLMICVSNYTAGVVAQSDAHIKTAVIQNGIDPQRFDNLPHVPKDGRSILSVGGVKPRKGMLELVGAMRLVCDAMPDARCSIAGSLEIDRKYAERVRARIAALNLTDSVKLLGRLDAADLRTCYALADVFALPSMNDGWRFEGFGLALLEGSAAGLPVIGSLGCGAEDAVDDGATGLLVPQKGVEQALADAILTLLNDGELRHKMGEAGRAKARAQTWDFVAQQAIALYEKGLVSN